MSLYRQWHKTLFTYIWIFNTGRGLSICIRFPHNIGILYDLGASDEFSPTKFVAKNIAPHLTSYSKCAIAQCFLSHPHADHISEIDAISDGTSNSILYPALLTCPNDKSDEEKVDFNRIKNKDNSELINKYRALYTKRNPPLQTLENCVPCSVPNVEYGLYYMPPPYVDVIHKASDQHYGNGLSLAVYLRHGNQTILIPGDITPEVFAPIIDDRPCIAKRYTVFGRSCQTRNWHTATSDQPALGKLLSERGLSVLVAPHHGLESCFSEKLFEKMRGGKPMINAISEKRHLSDTDGKVDDRYQSEIGASGLDVDIDGVIEKKRKSVSTRNGHHILIVFQGTNAAPRIYLRKTAEELLKIS